MAVPPPQSSKSDSPDFSLAKLSGYLQQLQSQVDLYYSEHQRQAGLIDKPSFSGFAGYWTNKLFNSEIPPLVIWANAYGGLAGARTALNRQDVAGTFKNLIRARRAYLITYKRYIAWKEGIQSAGTKAQVATTVGAFLAVAAFVAPAVVAALARTPGGPAAAEQMTARIVSTISNADKVTVAAEAIMDEQAIMAEAELEAEMALEESLESEAQASALQAH